MNDKQWRQIVYFLNAIEISSQTLAEYGVLTIKEHQKIKRLLSEPWVRAWDFYPTKNDSVSRAFKWAFQDSKDRKKRRGAK